MPDPDTDTLEKVDLRMMERTFAVNAYGPVLLTQALLPNVLAAPAPRRIGVISSRVGSIADNSSGGKTCLAIVTMSIVEVKMLVL